jgi:hypothetical protein
MLVLCSDQRVLMFLPRASSAQCVYFTLDLIDVRSQQHTSAPGIHIQYGTRYSNLTEEMHVMV